MLNVIILSVVKLNVVAPYSQHFTSFVNYEWAQEARVLNYTWLERLDRDKYSSLLGPFVSSEENINILRNLRMGPKS